MVSQGFRLLVSKGRGVLGKLGLLRRCKFAARFLGPFLRTCLPSGRRALIVYIYIYSFFDICVPLSEATGEFAGLVSQDFRLLVSKGRGVLGKLGLLRRYKFAARFLGPFLRTCLPSGRRALIVKRTYFPRCFWVWFCGPKSGHEWVAACVGSPKASSQLLRAHVETVALTPRLTARLLWLISRFFFLGSFATPWCHAWWLQTWRLRLLHCEPSSFSVTH